MKYFKYINVFILAFLILGLQGNADEETDKLIPFKNDGTWVYKDKSGKIVTRLEYVDYFNDKGLARAKLLNGKWGFIDKTGRFVINPKFDWVDAFIRNDFKWAEVKFNGKIGLIDQKGRFIVEPIFSGIWPFTEGLAAVTLNGKSGYIDTEGKIVIEPRFEQVGFFINGVAWVRTEGKWGIIDTKGKFIISPQFEDNNLLEDEKGKIIQELKRVKKNDKWGVINEKTGEYVLDPKFDYIGGRFKKGLTQVCLNSKWGFIDRTGKFVIQPQFEFVDEFKNGLAKVNINGECKPSGCCGGKWGLIDENGRIVMNPTFDYLSDFLEEIAKVGNGGVYCSRGKYVGGKWGLIDRSGKIIVDPKFDFIGNFSEGLATVVLDEKWGFIDKKGTLVIHLKFDKAKPFQEGIAFVQFNNNSGYTDKKGEFIPGFRENYYKGLIGDKLGVFMKLNMEGKKVAGYYSYELGKKPIKLEGTVDNEGRFDITETVSEIKGEKIKERKTGAFRGKFTSSYHAMDGEWSSPEGKRKLPFKLKVIAGYRELESAEGALSIGYPYFYLDNVSLQEKVNALLQEKMKKGFDDTLEEADELAEPGWGEHTEYSLKYFSGSLISILFEHEFTGGAHPTRSYSSLNLWLKPDSVIQLKLSDLFKPNSNYLMVISDICIQNLKAQGEGSVVKNKKNLSDEISEFSITPKGLSIIFQPYSLGSYMEYFVNVPYKKLETVINQKGPLGQMIKENK